MLSLHSGLNKAVHVTVVVLALSSCALLVVYLGLESTNWLPGMRRRTLLRRWWDAADQVYRHGKIRARGLQDRILSEHAQQVANLRASAGSPSSSWRGKQAASNKLRESVSGRTPASTAKQPSLRGSVDAGQTR